jgi:signal transduction histidine kinase
MSKKIEESYSLLEDRVKKAVLEIREKDQTIIKQSRQAAMGEMISNIAHHWRQPLNAIGVDIQDLQDAFEYGELDGPYIENTTINIMNSLTRMSRTIEDFRNFFQSKDEKEEFILNRAILKSIDFVSSTFDALNITIKFNYSGDDIKYSGYPSEFNQTVVSILMNAKDELIARKIEKPYINIILIKNDNSIKIEIEDNAGGIDNAIIDKVFEPYFTTKEQGKGAGIGLYMAKMAIEKSMDGALTVHNAQNGACFVIEF